MLAHGFTIPQMVELICAGLATATAECMVAGGHKLEVARVRLLTRDGGGWPRRVGAVHEHSDQ
jgi:hypothetical protein